MHAHVIILLVDKQQNYRTNEASIIINSSFQQHFM